MEPPRPSSRAEPGVASESSKGSGVTRRVAFTKCRKALREAIQRESPQLTFRALQRLTWLCHSWNRSLAEGLADVELEDPWLTLYLSGEIDPQEPYGDIPLREEDDDPT